MTSVSISVNPQYNGTYPSTGTSSLFPTTQVMDPVAASVVVPVTPVTTSFTGSAQLISVTATDTGGLAPLGWAWNLSFSTAVPGGPAPVTFYAPAGPCSFTATGSSPSTFTWTPTTPFAQAFPAGLPNGTAIILSGGGVPSGFTAGTTYWVVSTTATTFQLAAIRGGSPLAASASGGGTFTVTQYSYTDLAPVASYFPELAPHVPASQAFTLANNAYKTLQSWTVQGQADDPLPAFGLVAGSQTYGTSPAVQGPAFWYGYNPAQLSGSVASGAHGAAGLSCFGDAGDTNNGAGGHGLEVNPACFVTPNGLKRTNALEMVAVDDNTNTVNAIIRCGTGNSNGTYSAITLQNSDASKTYLSMGPNTGDQVAAYRPVTIAFDTSALGSAMLSVANSNTSAGSASILLDVGNSAGVGALYYRNTGVNKWGAGYSAALAGWYYVEDMANSRFPFRIAPGASAAATQLTLDATVLTTTSVVVNNGGNALATNATSGFLYIPESNGAPTGVPAAETGSVAMQYDVANHKIWVYDTASSGWKGIIVV